MYICVGEGGRYYETKNRTKKGPKWQNNQTRYITLGEESKEMARDLKMSNLERATVESINFCTPFVLWGNFEEA